MTTKYLQPGPTTFAAADLTELGNIVTTDWLAGTRCFVTSVADVYVLVKSGSYTANGASIIAGSGSDFWLSTTQGRWTDIQGDISQGTAGAALTYEAYRDTPFNMYFFRHDQDDKLSLRLQLPHEWDKATDIYPHLHIIPMVSPSSSEVVVISGQYAWADHGQAVPATASWTTFKVTHTVGTADGFKPTIISLGAVSPTGNAKESSILLIFAQRPGSSDVDDTYTTSKASGTAQANVGLLSLDVHYRKKQQGTPDMVPP